MTLDWRENELKISSYLTGKAAEIAKATGPSRMDVRTVTGKYNIASSGNTHNTGGVIMGTDPATSAVNRYLQSWDVNNVFVIGGSAFPQNGANNPTATIGALAFRAADAIRERYLKRPGSLA
jgi:gluconate 2-dehydrogenase alpha chain